VQDGWILTNRQKVVEIRTGHVLDDHVSKQQNNMESLTMSIVCQTNACAGSDQGMKVTLASAVHAQYYLEETPPKQADGRSHTHLKCLVRLLSVRLCLFELA
jgi:hypothetical protein